MVTICLALVAVGLAISLPLTRVMIGVGRRVGQMDAPDAPGSGGRKSHARAVPSTGGVAIFLAVLLPMLAGLAAVWLVPVSDWTGPLGAVGPHVEGLRRQTPLAVGVLAALAVVHVLGLVDDRRRLGPYSKLLVQLGVAVVLAAGFGVRVLEFLGGYGPVGVVASLVISVAWIVVVTNALNFLDNMDGLAAGVGVVCGSLYLAATLLGGQWFVAALAALLVGALLGFLAFNFPPARVFMGDGGSLVLGLLLAIISVRTTYLVDPAAGATGAHPAAVPPVRGLPGGWYGVLMPVMVLAVPLYDFTSVTLIRLSQGKSPFVGDQNHFSHRLVRKGLSKRTAVIVVWLCALATGLSGVMLGRLEGWQAALAAAQSAAVLAVLAILERSRTIPGGRDAVFSLPPAGERGLG